MTTGIVIAAMGLQLWTIIKSWPHRRDPFAIAIAVAAAGLAVRSGSLLVSGNVADITQEILIAVVSSALLISVFKLSTSRSQIEDYAIAVMDRSPSPILIKKASGEYLYVNKAFEENYEKTSAELIGKHSENVWPEAVRAAGQVSDKVLLDTQKTTSHLLNFPRSDGTTRHWHVNKFLLPLPTGDAGIATMYTDISERQEYQRRLTESEERYNLASRHAGIWDWHIETNKVYISPAFARMVGWDEEKATGVTINEINSLIHPEDYQKHRETLRAHISNHAIPYDIDYRFRMPDGTYRWFHAVGQSISNDSGQLVRMAGMVTDIDSERTTVEALRVSEAQIATLLDNSPAPIYFKDKNLRFVMINQRYADVYGVEMEDAVGRTSLELFPTRIAESFMSHDREVLESRSLVVREEQVDDATFLTAKFPIIDRYGNLLGVGGIETDISKRVSVEMAYRQARDDAEAANRSKSAFLANMSHELRTPLNSVIGFSDSLLTGTLGEIENPLHREYLAIIRTAGEHLLDLINDILDLSRIEAGKLELEEAVFDLEKVIAESIRLTAERAGSVGLLVSSHIDAGLPHVRADERQIKQVIINLISNAIKFTEAGGQVKIRATRLEGEGLEVCIEDNGVGISAENLERVQKPFIQVADAMTRQHTGSGLGLAIVRSIIKLHGGQTRLESELGKGTKVTFVLPERRLVTNKD